MDLEKKIQHSIEESIRAAQQLDAPENRKFILEASELLVETFENEKKVLLAGNGGSLCDAAHFAEELTGFFRGPRRPLPALVLSEPGHITCTGNDEGFEYIFSRGVEAFGQPGDLFIGLTTSGNSPNIIRAFEAAKKKGLKTIAFLGKGGGKLKGAADLEMIINGFKYSDRVQEAHMAAIHIIIEMMEEALFKAKECVL
jgi:D-sedoheptulose 7-phosphate isomerase